MKTGFILSKPFAALSFIISFLVYLFTLAPSVWIIDSSELAVAASKLGIAHPTGYPLFTILGRIFVLLIPAEPAFSLNIMSALYVSLSLLILFISSFTGSTGRLKNERRYIINLLLLAPVLALGFTLTIWDFATSLEVYSLQMLFFSVLIYIIFRIYKTENKNECCRLVFLLAFVLGLSFTNHLTTIILIPGIIYILFISRRKLELTVPRVMFVILMFITGLSVYIYLPVRNSAAIFNWGDPGSLNNIIKHVTGGQYARYKVSTGFINSIGTFIQRVPLEFTWPLILIIASGIIFSFISDKKVFVFLFLILITNLFVTSFYNIPDISNYYLISLIVLSIFSGYGLIYLYLLIKPYFKKVIFIIPLVLLIPLSANYSKSDKRTVNPVDKFCSNIFNSLEENAILLTGKWDYIVTPALYYQNIKNIRHDVTIIDIKLIKTSWYIKYLMKSKPGLYAESKPYFDTHLEEALKFESGKDDYLNPKSRNDIDNSNRYRDSYMQLLKNIIETHPGKLYTTYDVPADSTFWILNDYTMIPVGILLKYSKNNTFINFDDLNIIDYSLQQNEHPYFRSIKENYLISLINRSKYLVRHRNNETAKKLLKKALEIDSGYVIAKDLLRKLE